MVSPNTVLFFLALIRAAYGSDAGESCVSGRCGHIADDTSLLQTTNLANIADDASPVQTKLANKAQRLLVTEEHTLHTTKPKKPISTKVASICGGGALLLIILGLFLSGGRYDKCFGEFLGTFMLVFSVGCNVILGNHTWGVTSIAFTLMVSIYALAHVCGSHFNPAVSVACGLINSMGHKEGNGLGWREVLSYVCSQLSGGLLAGLSYSLLLGDTIPLGPKGGHAIASAGVAEMLYTFMLVFVVLNTACSTAHAGKNQFYGLAIGFVVIAGGYGAGSISGGCFNPAVAFGLDCSGWDSSNFGNFALYWAFEILGCVLAATFFAACRPGDFRGALSEHQLFPSVTSEFLGTYFLVLTVGLNVTAKSPAGAYSIAASLMCMIFALGSVSGAHFNPSVTIAILCSGRKKINVGTAFAYIFVQVVGGLAAGFTFLSLQQKSVALGPGAGATIAQASIGELLFTFLLCYVVLSVATVREDKTLSQMFGLAIGGCVVAGGVSIGSISGGSLNPAVSGGLAVTDSVHTGAPIGNLFAYVGVEVAGGILAAVAFAITHRTIALDAEEQKLTTRAPSKDSRGTSHL